jgi:hypothetical protein
MQLTNSSAQCVQVGKGTGGKGGGIVKLNLMLKYKNVHLCDSVFTTKFLS